MHRTLERLRAEFLEMPGLRLTLEQVQRLCGVEPTMCQAILDAMVDAKFLRRKPDGTYARLSDGELSHQRPTTAKLSA
jgi:DNA-binding IclR family transcriptional regulator